MWNFIFWTNALLTKIYVYLTIRSKSSKKRVYFPIKIGTRQANKTIPGIRTYIYFEKDISKVNMRYFSINILFKTPKTANISRSFII